MRLPVLLICISSCAFGQIKCCFTTDAQKIVAYDSITRFANVSLWHGPENTVSEGGFYTDTGLTTLCADGQLIQGLKSGGNSKPSTHNLPFAGSLPSVATAKVWYKDLFNTVGPTYFNHGQWDKGMRVHNGPANTEYFETAGTFSSNKTHPIDIYKVIRYRPNTPDEGVNRMKPRNSTPATERVEEQDGFTPDIATANGSHLVYYVVNLIRTTVQADGSWTEYTNGVLLGSGSAGATAFSTNEWIWGTSSHAMDCDIMWTGVKWGIFSASEAAIIERNAAIVWPQTTPKYPFLTDAYQGDATVFNGTTNVWSWPSVAFIGGNGTQGTTLFMWFCFDSGDVTMFPNADVLENHLQIPPSVNISTIASTNSVTSIDIDGVLMCSPCGTFATSATATADAMVTTINAYQTAFTAQRKSTATIRFWPTGTGCNNYAVNDITIVGSGFSPTSLDAPRGATLDRDTYAVPGQIFDGHEGDNTIKIARMCKPCDSNGVCGEWQSSRWVPDNIAYLIGRYILNFA